MLKEGNLFWGRCPPTGGNRRSGAEKNFYQGTAEGKKKEGTTTVGGRPNPG